MTNFNEMVEQHILEYKSRQKHAEELLAQAREHIGAGPEHAEMRSQIEQLANEYARLSGQLDQLKRRESGDWREEEIEQAGGLAVWDVLAQELEKLVEKLTGH
jgi:hypothetical protein